jgi:hypothetical protein
MAIEGKDRKIGKAGTLRSAIRLFSFCTKILFSFEKPHTVFLNRYKNFVQPQKRCLTKKINFFSAPSFLLLKENVLQKNVYEKINFNSHNWEK